MHDNSFGKIKSSCKQLKSDSPVYVVLYSSAQSERLYLIRGGPKYRVCFQGRCHCRSRIKSVNGATSTHPMANSNHKSEISECVPAHIAPSEKDKLLKNTNTTSKTIHWAEEKVKPTKLCIHTYICIYMREKWLTKELIKLKSVNSRLILKGTYPFYFCWNSHAQ